MIGLSARLMAIARMIPPAAAVLDVGTDHARLPIWLWQNGVTDCLTATDLHEEPLRRAEAHLRRCGLTGKIPLLLRDGLTNLSLADFDVVVIAGLSGETIMKILSEAPAFSPNLVFLLQPVTHPELLRGYLFSEGYSIDDERLCWDEQRIRTVMKARRQPAESHTATTYVSDALLSHMEDPLLRPYLTAIADRLTAEIHALSRSSRTSDARRLILHKKDLAALSSALAQCDNHH